MSSDHGLSRRWIGIAVGAALVLGACGAGATDEASMSDTTDAPAELALDAAETDGDAENEAEVDDSDAVAEGISPDLETIDLTPEMFEELKTDEVSRAAILVEMRAQGLDAEEAECFLDTVSPGLFITFSVGEQPDDEQFAELLQLLDTCQIAFGQ